MYTSVKDLFLRSALIPGWSAKKAHAEIAEIYASRLSVVLQYFGSKFRVVRLRKSISPLEKETKGVV
jgi:hypothetical protein